LPAQGYYGEKCPVLSNIEQRPILTGEWGQGHQNSFLRKMIFNRAEVRKESTKGKLPAKDA
jgi:hypothetical protein